MTPSPERRFEPPAKPREKCVSRRVAVRVVVDLEAVQVEQHERRLALLQRHQVGEQLAPVAETREGVGGRVDPAQAEHPQVLLEDQGHARDHCCDTRSRKREREQVHGAEVVVDEHEKPDDAEGGGKDECAPVLNAHTRLGPRLPDCKRDDGRGDNPAGIDDAVAVVAGRCLEDVRDVCDPEEQEAEQQQRPAAAEPPAGRGQAADHDRDERQVAERIRQVGGDCDRGTARGVDDRAECDCGAGGADRESPDRRIEQRDRLATAGDALAEEQHDPGDGWKVEEDPARIGRGREGHRVGVPQRNRVVESAECPEGLPGCDQQPAKRRPVGSQCANGDHEGGQGGSERRHPAKRKLSTASIGTPTVVCAMKRHDRTMSANSAKRATSLPTRTTIPGCSALPFRS